MDVLPVRAINKYNRKEKQMNKDRSTFLNNCYEWLFSEEERQPVAFIVVFFMIVGAMAVTVLIVRGLFYVHGYY